MGKEAVSTHGKVKINLHSWKVKNSFFFWDRKSRAGETREKKNRDKLMI